MTKNQNKDEPSVSTYPKANITLEKSLINDVKEFIKRKKKENKNFNLKTPTALIREATRSFIYPEISPVTINQENIDELTQRVKSIEKSRDDLANRELEIYLKASAQIISLFDEDHDFFEILKINMDRLDESQLNALEFREFSRLDIEKFFLDNLNNPPEEYKDLFVSNSLLQLLMMFLFLCNLGFTRQWDVIDPLAPMSQKFIDLLKKMIEKKEKLK